MPERLDDLNAGFAAQMFEQWVVSPGSVAPEWQELFTDPPESLLAVLPGLALLRGGAAPAPAASPAVSEVRVELDEELAGGIAAAMSLIKAHRTHGHLAARLDPLGSEPVGDPALDPDTLTPRLTVELQARVPARLLRTYAPGETLAEVLPQLKAIYCGSIAYEIEHISDHQQRVWLREAIESGRYRASLDADRRRALYRRLCEVEGLERFLSKSFLGQKQFSLEGLDVMIPMLDRTIELAAGQDALEIVIGMAHRGRLNVLAHVLGMPYQQILREFEGERAFEAVAVDPEGGTGDVKYHLGAHGVRHTPAGDVQVTLAANPSHLETVNPVVEGWTRAMQTEYVEGATIEHEPFKALAVLIHGDAAFAGQGVVAETFNLQALSGYSTGGTLHLIANNQVGFTTDPCDDRSTRYSSDLAKGFDCPVIHVNADDPEAAVDTVALALAYRERFGQDVVIDLVGYRRHGHNEQDEPAYTQPLQAAKIKQHPTVREQLEATLLESGLISEQDAADTQAEVWATLKAAHEELKASFAGEPAAKTTDETVPAVAASSTTAVTAVAEERLRQLNAELLDWPEGFTPHPKLAKQLERRASALDEQLVDWGQAEALAFASLLVDDGVPIRITGQDTERGTFSHRHAVLHDVETGQTFTPLQALSGASAPFEIHNSPLSEYAALGFEYGYAVARPKALVVWEAQFGDFANGAQIIIDQFISASLSKWHESSRLTLLLPHGYEGNGPEHSSARLERFLQLSAQENIRVCNVSTAAQHFHLMRRQALDPVARPLVVMTPKGLLKLKAACSGIADLAEGSSFQQVIADPTVSDPEKISRLVLCSGKVFYDIQGHQERAALEHVAVGRIEQLYPFPMDAAASLVERYPNLRELVWAQEEPQNMGAFRSIRHRLEMVKGPKLREVGFAGRAWRASPAEGYPTAHLVEQERIVRQAIGI